MKRPSYRVQRRNEKLSCHGNDVIYVTGANHVPRRENDVVIVQRRREIGIYIYIYIYKMLVHAQIQKVSSGEGQL